MGKHIKEKPLEMYDPPHPGETLKELYLKDYNISVTELALKAGISRKHLSNIINCKVPITTDVALKLAKCFHTSAEVWLREQLAYDLWHARQTVNLDDVQGI